MAGISPSQIQDKNKVIIGIRKIKLVDFVAVYLFITHAKRIYPAAPGNIPR